MIEDNRSLKIFEYMEKHVLFGSSSRNFHQVRFYFANDSEISNSARLVGVNTLAAVYLFRWSINQDFTIDFVTEDDTDKVLHTETINWS